MTIIPFIVVKLMPERLVLFCSGCGGGSGDSSSGGGGSSIVVVVVATVVA